MHNIRKAVEKDMSALIDLCADHAAYEKADYDSNGKADALEDSIFGSSCALHCLVVEINESLIGYATFMEQYSTWDAQYYVYMDCLYLREASRGKGIGEELVNAIRVHARAKGISHIQWQTPDFNVRAIKFYNRIGAFSKNKERFFLSAE